MFIDTSAFVAILLGERTDRRFIAAIEAAATRTHLAGRPS